MARTIEERIRDAEQQLARLRDQGRATQNGQKIILGGMLLQAARTDATIRTWLLKEAGKSITRDVDKKRMAPVLTELEGLQQPVAPQASQGAGNG